MQEDNIKLKLEITFFLKTPADKEKVKEQLEDLGWFLLQESKLTKVIKAFPGTIETGYDVVVDEI